jgi:hypothetical protein
MKWFRLYHEARTDAKLDSLPDDEFRVWFRLLCFANEQEERGVIQGFSDRLLAVEVARGNVELLTRTLDALTELRIVERDDSAVVIRAWGKRQRKSDDVAARVADYRSNEPKPENGNDTVTECNVTSPRLPVTETPPEVEAEADTDSDTDLPTTPTARAPEFAKATAEILTDGSFVGDELADVISAVQRSFKLRPEFPVRDGPLLAEKFIRWRGYKKKPPKDWYAAWLNWLSKEQNHVEQSKSGKPGGSSANRRDPASQIGGDAAGSGYPNGRFDHLVTVSSAEFDGEASRKTGGG